MVPVPFILLLALAFLLGSVPFAYLFVKKLKGIDIRTHGSGNVGATNAGRLLGKPMGVLIMLLDVCKGVVSAGAGAALLALWVEQWPLGESARGVLEALGERGAGLSFGIAAFLGHCYSPFLGFRAGKGVATALGVYVVVAPAAILVTFALCGALILVTRIISLASIAGAVLLPVTILIIYWNDDPWPLFCVTSVLGAVVVYRHRANIGRLMAGTEGKKALAEEGGTE